MKTIAIALAVLALAARGYALNCPFTKAVEVGQLTAEISAAGYSVDHVECSGQRCTAFMGPGAATCPSDVIAAHVPPAVAVCLYFDANTGAARPWFIPPAGAACRARTGQTSVTLTHGFVFTLGIVQPKDLTLNADGTASWLGALLN